MLHRLTKLAIAAGAVALVVFAWGPRVPAHAVFQDTDGDGAIDIAEQISGSDPNNAASSPENTAVSFLAGIDVCTDGIDNDLDGVVDAADPGCHDSDSDLAPDDVETRLGSDPDSAASFPEDARIDALVAFYLGPIIQFCHDGVDNDGDGLTDAADPSCAPIRGDSDNFDDATEKLYGSDPANPNSVPEHEIPNPGSCSDGIDNDLDGLIDGADPGCGVPVNDNRANATVVTTLPYTDGPRGVKNATAELSEPRPSCAGSVSLSVWYRYDATADGVLIADTIGGTLPSALAVWQEKDSGLSEVDCDARSSVVQSLSRVAFRTSAGQRYFFQIGGYSGGNTMPTVAFHLAAGTPPPNDSLSTLTAISALPFADAVDTSAATTQAAEPRPSCDDLRSTVWYRYTPSQDTLLVADTEGSDYPAGIGVWTDSKFGLTEVTCGSSVPFLFGPTPAPTPALEPTRVAVRAIAGDNYYFQVGGSRYGTSFGHLGFHLAVGVPPANDDFANAIATNTLPFSSTVDTLTASLEPNEPKPNCFVTPSHTVWYRYTPSASGYLKASVRGEYGALLTVYQGTAIDALTLVGCGGDTFGPSSLAAFPVSGGQTYYFQAGSIGGFGGGPPFAGFPSGEITFQLEELVVPSCAASQFTVSDPAGDTTSFGFGPPSSSQPPLDIVSVEGGSDTQNFCLRVHFASPIPQNGATPGSFSYADVGFDTDQSAATGFSSGRCGANIGVDLDASFGIPSGILVQLYPFVGGPGPLPPTPSEPVYGYALFDDQSFNLIVPLDALGGNNRFAFSVVVSNNNGSDCAPNGGAISSPVPAQPGDVNCDGAVDTIDSALVLQQTAGLYPAALPCQFAGDVNGSGGVGPVDATLILQYSSGLLTAFPAG